MILKETKLKGAYVIELEKEKDERGFFARSFCRKEFKKRGIDFNIVQSDLSYNKRKGILRGMHYQAAPHEEAKIVTCVKGAVYDVIIDLRAGSSTYCKWFSLELNTRNYTSLYIPEGFAHGFQALADDTVVLYQMSEFYYPGSVRGARWDDRSFNIKWPILPCILSDKDATYPDFRIKQ